MVVGAHLHPALVLADRREGFDPPAVRPLVVNHLISGEAGEIDGLMPFFRPSAKRVHAIVPLLGP